MKVQAIIPAAGVGKRFLSNDPKTLVRLKDKPIFIWTLLAFQNHEMISSIILVVHKDYFAQYEMAVKDFKVTKVASIVAGGETRFDSVSNGINALDNDTDIVLVHDGARPLIDEKTITQAIDCCRENGTAVVGVKVKPTIKRVSSDFLVEATLDRTKLYEIQTPQVFKKDLIVRAYSQKYDIAPTDDSSVVEKLGVDIKILKGQYTNIKITTPEDLWFAESVIDKEK